MSGASDRVSAVRQHAWIQVPPLIAPYIPTTVQAEVQEEPVAQAVAARVRSGRARQDRARYNAPPAVVASAALN